ncbi:MAG: formylmethanofuran dehydrogenase subunit B [Promethearchaeota archaeon]
MASDGRSVEFTCPGCGLLCDDVTVVIGDGGEVKKVANACSRGLAKIREYGSNGRLDAPLLKDENGNQHPVPYEQAVERVSALLESSRAPAFYGWSSTSIEAQQVGFQLAKRVRGYIDGTSSICQGQFQLAEKTVGGASCTLGDVINKADLVVYWGANPIESHPRLVGRSVFSRGMFRISGKEMKKLVTIDVRPTATAHMNEMSLQIDPGTDYEILAALRAHLEADTPLPKVLGGVPRAKWVDLLEFFENSEFPVVFVGLGLTSSSGASHNAEAVIEFIQSLRKVKNIPGFVLANAGHYNMQGFTATSTSQTGQPFGVDFTRGDPRSNPGETTFVDLLRRDQVDTIFVVASDPAKHLPRTLVERLRDKKLVVVDYRETATTRLADVVIPCKVTGLEEDGTAVRIDHVPVPLRRLGDPGGSLKSDAQILVDILERMEKRD